MSCLTSNVVLKTKKGGSSLFIIRNVLCNKEAIKKNLKFIWHSFAQFWSVNDHILNYLLNFQYSIFLLHLGHGTTFFLAFTVIFTWHQCSFYQCNLKLNILINYKRLKWGILGGRCLNKNEEKISQKALHLRHFWAYILNRIRYLHEVWAKHRTHCYT